MKGDNYVWNDSVAVQVTREAEDGSWADIACQNFGDIGMGTIWTKRMPLPFPESFVKKEEE